MLEVFEASEAVVSNLKKLVEQRDGDIGIRQDPLLASLIACIGIKNEIGTVNDELYRHVFVVGTNQHPSLSSMKAEIVKWKGHFGVRIFSTEAPFIEMDHPQLIHLLQPELSRDESGHLFQLVLFPKIIADIISLQDVELVIVKDWALNTIFGGFNSDSKFYVTNDWEIRQNDGLRMAKLLSERKLAFFGTHDLVAHVAGVDGKVWNKLQDLVEPLIPIMLSGQQEAISHLIISYIIGVILDDLAQPFHYDCSRRLESIKYLARLQRWVVHKVPPYKNFRKYPKSFSAIIEGARYEDFSMEQLKENIRRLSMEVQIFGEARVA